MIAEPSRENIIFTIAALAVDGPLEPLHGIGSGERIAPHARPPNIDRIWRHPPALRALATYPDWHHPITARMNSAAGRDGR